jgi:hypothetical protein
VPHLDHPSSRADLACLGDRFLEDAQGVAVPALTRGEASEIDVHIGRPRPVTRSANDARGVLEVLLGVIEAALVESDLTDVGDIDRVHDGIAGSVHGDLRPLVQLKRLVPLAAKVGEHAEHVEYTRLAREVVELFEKGEGTDPVDRLLELA